MPYLHSLVRKLTTRVLDELDAGASNANIETSGCSLHWCSGLSGLVYSVSYQSFATYFNLSHGKIEGDDFTG